MSIRRRECLYKTPELNAIAERIDRTIVEAVRVMLIKREPSKWFMAICLGACYVR